MTGAQIAIVISAIATLGTIYVGYIQNRNSRDASEDEGSRARLELAFEMQEKHIGRLEARVEAQDKRLQLADERNLALDTQLQECKQGRHNLEVQVEILKMRVGNDDR